MDSKELTRVLVLIPIKLIIATIIVFNTKMILWDDSILTKIFAYSITIICLYGWLSIFANFFRGGRIISGIITSILFVIIMYLVITYVPDGIVKNIIICAVSLGGLVLDIIVLISAIKERKNFKSVGEKEDVSYGQATQQAYQQAAQQEYQQAAWQAYQQQTHFGQRDYSSDGAALQQIINQFYESENRATELYKEIADIVYAKNLPTDEMKQFLNEHDSIIAVADAIRGRIQQNNYQNSDLAPFRDRFSQCYTDLEIFIRKLETYLSRIRN